MYCNKCGNEINEQEKFCGRCGNTVTPSPNNSPVSTFIPSGSNANELTLTGRKLSVAVISGVSIIIGLLYLASYYSVIISDELYEKAQRKKAASATGKPVVGRGTKHLLSGILRCPMCGSSMYADIIQWTNQDGTKRQKLNYQCGHYAKAKHGNCKKNAILGEWIEAEVIAYTKLLVRNPLFVQDIKSKIGKKVDVSEIDIEINNYQKRIAKLERSKNKLEQDIDNLSDDDKRAERKRNDMNRRLNKLYEEIYEIEDQIVDCEQRKQAAEHKQLSTESIYKILLAFDQLFDKMNPEEQRKVLESLISEVHLHPKETWKEDKNPIKEIKYTFPVSSEVMEELRENVLSVETCILLSHKKPDSHINVKVEFGQGEGKVPIDKIAERVEAYKPKEKVTYKMIQEYIEKKYDFKVHTAYIAEVKRDMGLPMYDAPNAVEELKQPRKHPTPEKVEAIKDALKYFKVV